MKSIVPVRRELILSDLLRVLNLFTCNITKLSVILQINITKMTLSHLRVFYNLHYAQLVAFFIDV